ncbi:hypothetical protein [Streptomyces sp. 7N604]|uniref:hypothetical protein n=1 Tax=Streptomyces sp. 7N604 TaxID=3457415 RepID=UPI003FD45F3D
MGSATLRPSSADAAGQMLGIYLNDHLAGATAGVELSRRMARAHRRSGRGDDVKRLATEIASDRWSLIRLMEDLDVPVRRYKFYGAWAGEKVGRLKLNGRLIRQSGLSVLLELETLRIGVEGKALLWSALLAAAADNPRLDADRIRELRDRAGQQMDILESLHADAASTLFRRSEQTVA